LENRDWLVKKKEKEEESEKIKDKKRSMEEYKVKRNIENNKKLFIVKGGYEDIKRSLLMRNYIE
jgi:hypothetical protein